MKESMNVPHLVIVRTSGSVLDLSTYNCQELGLAQTLCRRGWKVSLVLAGKTNEEKQIDRVNVYFCRLHSLNQQMAYFENIKLLLKRISPTVIQIHEIGLFMSWIVAKWAKKNGVPCFLIQGNYKTTQKPVLGQLESLFNMTLGRSILKIVKAVGYKTPMADRYVQKYLKVKSMPTYIGLDDSKFIAAKEIDWKKELHIEGKRVLLYIGNFENRRNPIFLIELLQSLPSSIVLIMAGDGPLFNKVSVCVKNMNLSNRCFLIGKQRQENLPSLYKSSDLFLLASNYEIYGMVILEAMYFGVPVVSTLTAGSESIIEDGKNGVVIDRLDVDLWKNVVLQLLNGTNKFDLMKEAAANKVKNELLWDKAADKFIDLYNY